MWTILKAVLCVLLLQSVVDEELSVLKKAKQDLEENKAALEIEISNLNARLQQEKDDRTKV